jgi:asparagine synthetase B (glutamine-hydrolysing)
VIIRENKTTNDVNYWISTDPLSVRPIFYFSNEIEFGVSSVLAGLSNLHDKVQRLDQGSMIEGFFNYEKKLNSILTYTTY